MYFCLCHKYYIDWRAAMSLRFKVISNSATYQLTRNVAGVDEGSTFQITLNTTGVQNGQMIPYVITGISQNDIAEPLSGYFVMQGGSANKTFTVYADVTTEGTEIFTLTLSDVTNKDVSVTINDTSTQPSGDPYWANVVILAHMDGTNGSTTFTDVKGHTITNTGSIAISTTTSMFGGASGFFPGTATNKYIVAPVDSTTGWTSFTIECWVNLQTTVGGSYGIWGTNGSGYTNGIGLYYNGGSTLQLDTNAVGQDRHDITIPNRALYNSWHHVAVSVDNRLVRVFVDGVIVNTPWTMANTGTIAANSFRVGTWYYSTARNDCWKGYIDELRITKGVARYTSNFTPAGPFLDA